MGMLGQRRQYVWKCCLMDEVLVKCIIGKAAGEMLTRTNSVWAGGVGGGAVEGIYK